MEQQPYDQAVLSNETALVQLESMIEATCGVHLKIIESKVVDARNAGLRFIEYSSLQQIPQKDGSAIKQIVNIINLRLISRLEDSGYKINLRTNEELDTRGLTDTSNAAEYYRSVFGLSW